MSTIEQIPQLPVRREKYWQQYLIDSLLAVGRALVVTGIIYAFHLYPTIPNISIVYLLVILALATTRGRYAAIVAAAVAFLAFDFFLVPPFYSFTISRWEEWIALFVFLATALIASQLATVTRQSVEQARLREQEARILYETGRVINSTDRLDEQLDSIVLALVRVFFPWGVRECALLLPDENGTLSIQADAPIRIERFVLSPDEMVAAREVMAQGRMREMSPTSSASSEKNLLLYLIPLKTNNQILGVLCLRVEREASRFVSNQLRQEEQEQPDDGATFVCSPSTPLSGLGFWFRIPTTNAALAASFAQVVGAEASDGLKGSTFFWTFLDQAILIIERARLRARAVSNTE